MDYNEAYARALRLLNVRFLSEGELRRKLKVRHTGDEVIDEVLETLRQEHFVDDQRLAEAVYAYYARKGQYGHRYIVSCRSGSSRCRKIRPASMNRLWRNNWYPGVSKTGPIPAR